MVEFVLLQVVEDLIAAKNRRKNRAKKSTSARISGKLIFEMAISIFKVWVSISLLFLLSTFMYVYGVSFRSSYV